MDREATIESIGEEAWVWCLCDEVVDDMAVDIGEAEVASGVAVGEFGVVEAEELHDGGLEVVDVDAVLYGLEAEVVGGAVDGSGFDAAACEDVGEAPVVVVSAVDFSGVCAFFG